MLSSLAVHAQPILVHFGFTLRTGKIKKSKLKKFKHSFFLKKLFLCKIKPGGLQSFFHFSFVFSFFPLFSRVVLLGFLLPFGRCCCFSFSFWWCCLPSPPLSGTVFSSPFVGWCCFLFGGFAVFPSPVWWCCLPSPSLSGVAFPLSCLVVLPSFSFLGWCCCFPSPHPKEGKVKHHATEEEKKKAPPNGGEGRQHHQKGEGNNSNTTQRKRKPSSTTPTEERENAAWEDATDEFGFGEGRGNPSSLSLQTQPPPQKK